MPGPGKPFKKGEPRKAGPGRPKVPEEFKAKCKAYTDETVLPRWIREVEEDGPNWVKAAELIAAYGHGKPSQQIQHANPDGSPLVFVCDLGDDA